MSIWLKFTILVATGLWAFCTPASALQLINDGQPQQFIPTTTSPEPTKETDWQPFTARAPSDDGTLILRHSFTVAPDNHEPVNNPLAIAVRLYGVYDFYWDGELIGSNRHLGKSANQFSRVIIPIRSLTPGKHEIWMHITALGLKRGEGLNIWISPAEVKADYFGVHITVVSTFLVATASFLVGAYLLILLRTATPSPGLRASAIISFSIFVMILLEESKHLFSYPYLWQPVVEALQGPVALLIYGLLSWITLTRLAYQPRLKWMTLFAAPIALSFIPFGETEHDIRFFSFLLITLICLSAIAWRKNHVSAKLFLSGFTLALAALWFDPFGKHLFLIVITGLLAIDLGIDIKRRAKEAQKSAIVTERLRADLIKRNIQPHFLMNSLTALMEWVETEPDQAIDFIDGLAGEFRTLADFAERDSVTFSEELTLCNMHVRLMSQRLSADITLQTSGTNQEAKIPPGIFHTLIENAFSHNNYAGKHVCFHIHCVQSENIDRYSFSVPLAGPKNASVGTGTGTAYVRARLEEFCGKAFSFTSQQVGLEWETIIEISQNRH